MTGKIAPPRHTWMGAERPGRDLVRFGLAMSVAFAFSAVQVFVIPLRIDIAGYGHFRLFLMYAGYAGLLHAGVADGAFLRWVGQRSDVIRREWTTVGRWLLGMHVVILLVALGTSFALGEPLARLFVVSLAAVALCANAVTLSSYALQAAGDFRGAGRVAVLAPASFVALVLLLPVVSLPRLVALYVVSCAGAAAYAAARVLRTAQRHDATAAPSAAPEVRSLVSTGLPVLGANLAAAVAQSADRILLSLVSPITNFALYSFASTVTIVGATATHAISRVALSHAATRPIAARAPFLAQFLDVIAAGYGVALVCEPALERLVTVMLPEYAAALPIARALVVGLPFWIATHVVLVGSLQAHGHVQRQFVLEMCGVTVVLIACGAALALHAPLWGVAAAATAASIATFGVAVGVVRRIIGTNDGPSAAWFGVLVAGQGGALLLAVISTDGWVRQSAIYLLLAAMPTALAVSRARNRVW